MRRARWGRPARRRWLALAALVLLLRALLARAWPAVPATAERWPVQAAGPALLVRDERVLVAPAAGRLERAVPDGAFVRAGDAVFRVARAGRAADLAAEAQGVRSRLAEAEQRLAAHPSGAALRRATAEVRELLARLREVAGTPEAGAAFAQLEQAWSEVRRLERGLGDLASEVAALRRRAAALASALAGVEVEVRAPRPGVVEWSVDGLEEELRLDAAPSWDPQLVQTWLAAAEDAVRGGFPDPAGGDVEAGQPVARLVDPARAALVASLAGVEPAALPPPGREVAVEVDGVPAPLRARVRATAADPSGAAVVMLDLVDGVPLVRGRLHRVRLALGHREGVAIPASALWRGQVAVRDVGGFRLQPVTALARTGDRVLVSGPPAGSRVALWPGVLRFTGLARPPGPARPSGGGDHGGRP